MKTAQNPPPRRAASKWPKQPPHAHCCAVRRTNYVVGYPRSLLHHHRHDSDVEHRRTAPRKLILAKNRACKIVRQRCVRALAWLDRRAQLRIYMGCASAVPMCLARNLFMGSSECLSALLEISDVHHRWVGQDWGPGVLLAARLRPRRLSWLL